MRPTWHRVHCSRLIRTIASPSSTDSIPEPVDFVEPIITMSVPLKDRCYPARSAQPSCISLPPVNGNKFEIKGHQINMLPNFRGSEGEDPYLFLHEFEEVCALQNIQQLTEDSIRLRLINFALKDNAKKWLLLPSRSYNCRRGVEYNCADKSN